MFAVGHEIRQYMQDAKDFIYSDAVVAERRIQVMDIDPARKLIYWADSFLKVGFSIGYMAELYFHYCCIL